MAKKTTYKPKEKIIKEIINNEKVSVHIEEKIENIVEKEIIDNTNDGLEIQISPLTPTQICKYKKITGVYHQFLEKKYATKSYTLEKWNEILIKENITY
jgi:hypothetical protein